jgi:hypothetical protein
MKINISNCFLLLVAIACAISCKDNIPPAGTVSEGDDNGFRLIPATTSNIHFRNSIEESIEFNFLSYPYIYNGGGVAIADFDMDGRKDIYLTANQGTNKLYRNRGNFEFDDITEKAGVSDRSGWSTGVSVADINADGFPDIYVCKSGSLSDANDRKNKLFINDGKGIFIERAADYGLADDAFSTQAYFFDYDLDNDLDMYLVNHRPDFTNNSKISTAIQQDVSPQTSDKLYRNDEGVFTDVTAAAGIVNKTWGLSAAIADFNEDGWPDVYICNDFLEPDHLWINNRNGTFTDRIHSSMDHISFYSMGSDMADINNDTRPDLVVLDMVSSDHERSKRNMASMSTDMFRTMVDLGYHHQYMTNVLQLNNGGGDFSDIGQLAGISKTDWSWSPLLADFDNDGYRDLLVTNGIKRDITDNDYKNELMALNKTGTAMTLQQVFQLVPSAKISNEIFRNSGRFEFEHFTEKWNLGQPFNSNGAAYADLDNDGDLDIVLNNMEDISVIYENLMGGNSLVVELEGPPGNPMGTGSTVEVHANGTTMTAHQQPARGFQSSVDPALHFGLGDHQSAGRLIVSWPDGRTEELTDVPSGKKIRLQYSNSTLKSGDQNIVNQLFKVIENPKGLAYVHRENNFDDFKREILLPQKQSTLGPAMAVADVNNDGLDDMYLGGARDQPASLYLQAADGTFTPTMERLWLRESLYEDIAAIFIDADSDGDDDLYVVSGGSEDEPGSERYLDRLYFNDGNGGFTRLEQALPPLAVSGGCVAASDIDKDGDVDLFIGGRTMPGKYPYPPRSYLLINENGRFTEAGETWNAALKELGMVTDAVFTDFDSDGDDDLVAVGHWMKITFAENTGNGFSLAEGKLESDAGWWYAIEASDMDGDGDEDLIAGNLGLNNKFQPRPGKPFHVYAADFDRSGSTDIVLSKEGKDKLLPVRGRECSSQQMPFITEKFPTYGDFAVAGLDEIYSAEALEAALHYQAETFASVYLENENGSFTMKKLPIEAQTGPTLGLVITDVNADGRPDIVGAGNIYNAEVETVRYDASRGYVLLGDGNGNFTYYPDSGLKTSGNVKRICLIDISSGKHLAVAANDGPLQLFRMD